jgi:four helix bundle protein
LDYKQLDVWNKSVNLVTDVYRITERLPNKELFTLSDQMKRSAISIPSNIAEGSGRNTTKEFIQFLHIASGSAAELETQLIIGNNIGYFQNIDYHLNEINDIKKMLNGLINSLRNSSRKR